MPIWFIIIICFLPIFLFMGWTKKFREKNPEIFGYILSLAGTFVGVLVGLYFNDLAATHDKRLRTVKVLEASKEELEWLINRAQTIDNITDTLSAAKQKKYYFLEMPPFYTETLRSELLAETLHPKSLEQFHVIRENLLFDVELLRKDLGLKDSKSMKEDLVDYTHQLKASIGAIDLEIGRITKTVSQAEFDRKAQQSIILLMAD
jgi:hypothetical protein